MIHVRICVSVYHYKTAGFDTNHTSSFISFPFVGLIWIRDDIRTSSLFFGYRSRSM